MPETLTDSYLYYCWQDTMTTNKHFTFQAVQVFGKQESEHIKSLIVTFSRALTELFTEEDIQSNSVDWNNKGFCFTL